MSEKLIARLEDNTIVEMWKMDSSEYETTEYGSDVMDVTDYEIKGVGMVYHSDTDAFDDPLHGIPSDVDISSLTDRPTPRFDGDTWSVNSRTVTWQSDVMHRVRTERDQKLQETDWTQTPDFPEGDYKTAMATYRQQLRDIPSTYENNPHEVVWPTMPNSYDY